jgi:hypothetical protein
VADRDTPTALSLPPSAAPISLPDRPAPAAPRARVWMLVVALLAGAATSFALAYALR